MDFFRRLREEGLRRLVKVVLNQTVGPYLDTHIELEQLELQSETGLFRIRNVPLNCKALNEFLIGTPVRITSASVNELNVTISWAAVNDGCRITFNGVRIALSPSGAETAVAASHPLPSDDNRNRDPAGIDPDENAGPEAEGVLFLANWIDIIVARFQIHLNDVRVEMAADTSATSPRLRLSLSNVEYFNSKPESAHSHHLSTTHSVSIASQSVSRVRGRDDPALSSVVLLASQEGLNEKLLVFSGLQCDFVCDERFSESSTTLGGSSSNGNSHLYLNSLLSTHGSGRVLIRSFPGKSSATDINITLPHVNFVISPAHVTVLTLLIASLSVPSATPSDHVRNAEADQFDFVGSALYGIQDRFRAVTIERTLKILQHMESDSTGESAAASLGTDMSQVAKLLKTYQNIRSRLENDAGSISSSAGFLSAIGDLGGSMVSSSAYPFETAYGGVDAVSEDEMSLVESDEDSADGNSSLENAGSDFFDASMGLGHSRINAKKSLRPVKETLRPVLSNQQDRKCGFTINLNVPSIIVSVSSGDNMTAPLKRYLQLTTGDISLNLTVPVPDAKSAAIPPTRLVLRIGTLAMVEVAEDSSSDGDSTVSPILYFGEYSENVKLNKSPPVGGISITDEVNLRLNSEFSNSMVNDCLTPRVTLSLKLNPFVVVVAPLVVLRWLEEIKPLMASGDADPSSIFDITADVSGISIVICPSRTLESAEFDSLVALKAVHAIGPADETETRWFKTKGSSAEYATSILAAISRSQSASSRATPPRVVMDCDSGIFFRVALHQVRLKLYSASSSSANAGKWFVPPPILEMERIHAYLRLEIDNTEAISSKRDPVMRRSDILSLRAYELMFLSSSSSPERKITVRRFQESDFFKTAENLQHKSESAKRELPGVLRSRLSRNEHNMNRVAAESSSAGDTDSDRAGEIKGSVYPTPPSLNGGEIFAIDAKSIQCDFRHLEYSLFIGVIDFFIPAMNLTVKKTDDISSMETIIRDALPKGVGVKLTAEVFRFVLSQDKSPEEMNLTNEQCQLVRKNYILATREPLIEFYSGFVPKEKKAGRIDFDSNVYIGLEVENVSIFELTDEQLQEIHCASGISTIGVKIGPGSHSIPVVHVTTFARDWSKDDSSSGNEPTNAPSTPDYATGRNWTLSIAALIVEDKLLNSINTLLNINFQDITMRYDPSSLWLPNLIEALTPTPLSDLVCSSAVALSRASSQEMARPLLETLHLRVSVKQALLDYCAVNRSAVHGGNINDIIGDTPSIDAARILLSMGLMTVGTTIVSTSHQLGLKIGIKDISLRLTNSILRDKRFELVPLDMHGRLATDGLSVQLRERGINTFRPCCRYFEDFVDAHSFVRMGKVRKMDMMLRLNGGVNGVGSGEEELDDHLERIDLDTEIDDVYFCGCADSLNVLSDAISILVADIKEATKFDQPAAKRKKIVLNNSVEIEPTRSIATMELRKGKGSELFSSPYVGGVDDDEDEAEDFLDLSSHRKSSTSGKTGALSSFSRNSSRDDVNGGVLSPPARIMLRPPSAVAAMSSGPLVTEEKGIFPSQQPLNLLSGISTNMFAPKSQEEEFVSSRMSDRSATESVLMEAIYDDEYPPGDEFSAKDMENFEIQFKRSERYTEPALSAVPLSESDLAYIRNKNARQRSLFNSLLDDDTAALFVDEAQGNTYRDDDEVYSQDESDGEEKKESKSQWSLFIRGGRKNDIPDQELTDFPESSRFDDGASDTSERAILKVNSNSALVPLLPPRPEWHVLAAAGTDGGANLAAYEEEHSAMPDDDAFLLVDYRDPHDNSKPEARWFTDTGKLDPNQINPHHIPILVSGDAEENEIVPPKILVKLLMSVRFQLLHGHDWSCDPDSSAAAVRRRLLKKAGLISSKKNSLPCKKEKDWNSNDELPQSHKVATVNGVMEELLQHPTGALQRKSRSSHRVLFADETKLTGVNEKSSKKSNDPEVTTHMNKDRAELVLNGVSVRFAMYAPDDDMIATWPVQRTKFAVNDIEIKFYRRDHRTKKILGYWKSKVPREINAPVVKVHLDTYVDTVLKSQAKGEAESDSPAYPSKKFIESPPPVEDIRDVEYVNRVSIVLLPLSVHLDAHFLDLVRSLGETFAPTADLKEPSDEPAASEREPPVSSLPTAVSLQQLRSVPRPIFFQQWKMSPISIRIYYEARAFDMVKFQNGDYLEILNCFPLDGLEITMKKILLYGVTGVQGGIDNTLRIWVEEIKANQLSNIAKILAGTAPLRGVATIGKGLHHNLIVMPAREFSRKGASGALQSVAGGVLAVSNTVLREALHAGAKATQMLANVLNIVNEPLVEEHTASRDRRTGRQVEVRAQQSYRRSLHPRSGQPVDLSEGGAMAYDALATSMLSAVDNVILVPIREYRRSGTGGAISSIIRAVPIAVLGPAAGAAQAMSYAFFGLRNQVDPARRRDEEAVYIDIEKPEEGFSRYQR